MNPNSFYKGNTGPQIKPTAEDIKQMEKQMLAGMGLINITKDLHKVKDLPDYKKYEFQMDENFIRSKFICEFLGDCVEEYRDNFNKHIGTCLFLNTACNYQSMKKFLFYFETNINCSENGEFNKKYDIEMKVSTIDDDPQKTRMIECMRFITFYKDGCIFFNIFYENLLMSMELFSLWLFELYFYIEISERKQNSNK